MIALVEDKREALNELCRRFHVKRLDIFGSAVTGKFDPSRSDFDFLVEFEELQAGEHADSYFGLLFGLEDLFGRQVDLVVDSAIRNPYFRADVDEHRRELYAA